MRHLGGLHPQPIGDVKLHHGRPSGAVPRRSHLQKSVRQRDRGPEALHQSKIGDLEVSVGQHDHLPQVREGDSDNRHRLSSMNDRFGNRLLRSSEGVDDEALDVCGPIGLLPGAKQAEILGVVPPVAPADEQAAIGLAEMFNIEHGTSPERRG